MVALAKTLTLVGRILLCLVFVLSGAMKLVNWQQTVDDLTARGLPLVPVLLGCAVACEVLGGLMVMIGFRARIGAIAMLVFLIPTTVMFHSFWSVAEAEQQGQVIHFLKNLSIMGGLMMVAALGPGPLSLDARRLASAPPGP